MSSRLIFSTVFSENGVFFPILSANQSHPSIVWTGSLATTDAILYPFIVTVPLQVTRMYHYNGGTAAGNFQLGIYNEDLSLLVATAATAQSGTSVPQWVDVTDTTLQPGNYFMALAADNVSFTSTGSNNVVYASKMAGVFKATTSRPLPATITLATTNDQQARDFGFEAIKV